MVVLSPDQWVIWFIAMTIAVILVIGVGVMAAAHVLPHPHLRRRHHDHLPH